MNPVAYIRVSSQDQVEGHSLDAQELQCLVEAGLTPMQALVAGTGWAAECLGLEKEIGTVEEGKVVTW